MRGAVAMAVTLIVSSSAHAVDTEDEENEVEIDPGAGPPAPPPPAPAPQREIDLMPRLTLAETVGWILVPEPEPSDPEERAERELDRRLAAHVMRDSLEHVGADGWYHHLGSEIRRELRVDSNESLSECDVDDFAAALTVGGATVLNNNKDDVC